MTEGWADLCQIEMLMFADVGLDYDSNDREVWRFAQVNCMILLTANRNMIGKDSLEQTLREENTPDSLPVITIGRAESLVYTVKSVRSDCWKLCCIRKIILELPVYSYHNHFKLNRKMNLISRRIK